MKNNISLITTIVALSFLLGFSANDAYAGGLTVDIEIEKLTNGEDADTPTGPFISVGETATFTYEVTNTGDFSLGMVVVVDDNGTPANLADDFEPMIIDDGNGDTTLSPAEVWVFQAERIVTPGQYTNEATVSARTLGDLVIRVSDMDPSNHFGEVDDAMIGDFVWEDLDADGIQDPSELDDGINGVEVKLLEDTDNDGIPNTIVDTTVTSDNPDTALPGWYKFNGLSPDIAYKVMFVNPDVTGPDALMFSPRQVGGDPTVDSDGPMSDIIVLSSGEFNDTIDAGLFKKGSIHVFGFLDEDGNGNFDPEDSAFPDDPGKTFELIDASDSVIDTQTTSSGMVWFTSLTPGTYTVQENPVPDGYTLTTLPNEREFTITSGQELVYEDGAAMLPDGDQRFETNLGDELRWGNFLKSPPPISVEKLWTHTNYSPDNLLPDPLEPENTAYAQVNKKGDFKNTNPGAFYAVTVVDVLVDIDSLTVWENYEDCTGEDGILELRSNRNNFNTALKVAIEDPTGEVSQPLGALYRGNGGSIDITIKSAHVEIDAPILAGSKVYVLVKFQDNPENISVNDGIVDVMCNNSETVVATIDDVEQNEVVAEASLRITNLES